ncbi:MAG: glycosyltransferase family 9 protein [Acidobacteriota bacterium]
MSTVLEQLPEGAKVGIIRLRSLGDCVLTTPAIHLLKRYRPDLKLAVVVEDRFAAVFRGNPDVDAVLSPAMGELTIWRPRLVINFHGGTRSMWLTALSLAGRRAGFQHYAAQGIYNVQMPRAQAVFGVERRVHTAEHLASGVFYLGVPVGEVPRARLFARAGVAAERPYAVIHPAASATDKSWSAAGFRAVAEHLRGLEPVFIGGPGDDLSAFAGFRTVVGAPLEETMTLLAGASLFVGNDSGPAHMAAALGVKQVVIFGPSDAETWAPWRVRAEVVNGRGSMGNVTVEAVLAAVDRL